MKYKCKENDARIEKHDNELWISVKGDKKCGKTIISLKDLNQALTLFGVSDLLLTEQMIKDEASYRQMEGAEPHSWEGGARWAKRKLFGQ